MNKLKKRVHAILLCSITFTFWVILSNFLIIFSTRNKLYSDIEQLPKMEFGLVLGTSFKLKNNQLNKYFVNRLNSAIELYRNNKIDKIIVSGDNSKVEYDETTDMANYLIEKGIPNADIIRDYAGFKTLDSVVRAKKVFNATSLTIISQEFHNERALFIANYYNINAIAFNCPDVQRILSGPPLREYLAKFGTILDLYLLNTQPKFIN